MRHGWWIALLGAAWGLLDCVLFLSGLELLEMFLSTLFEDPS